MRRLWQSWKRTCGKYPFGRHRQRRNACKSKGREMTYWPNWTGRARLILMLTGALLALTACDELAVSGATIDPPPPSLVQPCRQAVALPARALTQAEVESFWRADRARVAACREKHQGMVDWAAGVVEAAN